MVQLLTCFELIYGLIELAVFKNPKHIKNQHFYGFYKFYVEVCTKVFLSFFVCTILRILFRNILVTPYVTPPCTLIETPPPSYNISGYATLNSMFTTSTSLVVWSSLCYTMSLPTEAIILAHIFTFSSLNPQASSSKSALV